jgi:6-phosphogluconate dehydrogenase
MDANMAQRLMKGGHQVVAYDLNEAAVKASEAAGAEGARTLDEVVAKLTSSPRVAWVMVRSGKPTETTINALADRFAPGDVIIDGGNSNYKDSQRHAAELSPRRYLGHHRRLCHDGRRRGVGRRGRAPHPRDAGPGP